MLMGSVGTRLLLPLTAINLALVAAGVVILSGLLPLLSGGH